ncbi:hypothetical protein [Dyella agri]|uniref:Uncharacterized protein n=1 Tax=Dyella agri TaxID=1926869 RepID=A0ABW8KIB5_9GAMM
MSNRYFGKVVATTDRFTIVMNRGSEHGVNNGDKFLIVGIGPVIIDPDTQEELERLEIVRGKVSVFHVQEKISSARSCEFERSSDVKEIKKVTSRGGGVIGFLGPQDTVTESIKPGDEQLKELNGAQVGDLLLVL